MSEDIKNTLNIVGDTLVGLCMSELTDQEMTIYKTLEKVNILTIDENDEIKKAA